jgi:hypothetical protein
MAVIEFYQAFALRYAVIDEFSQPEYYVPTFSDLPC